MDIIDKPDRDLLWLYALGEPLSEQDSHRFLQIMDNSLSARDELRHHLRFKELMALGKNHAPPPNFIDETMRRLSTSSPLTEHNLLFNRLTKSQRDASRTWHKYHLSKVGFLAFVILVVIFHFYLIRPDNFYAPRGQEHIVVLHDQSQVKISGGSSLMIFPSTLRNKRKVVLEGEAYFSFKPGNKPFAVKTFNAVINGTSSDFSVRTDPNRSSQKTEIEVHEGHVDVASSSVPSKRIQLERGESTQVKSN